MVKMIIAFYPGAGGNRYWLMSQGHTEFNNNQAYDDWLRQNSAYRYINSGPMLLPDSDLILTHCMNVPVLKKLFPLHKIHIITSNFETSLRREWHLVGQSRENDMQDPVENAYATLSFHQRYYQEYPVDTSGADVVVDIESGTDAFCVMMQAQLALVNSVEFDQALDQFKQVQPHDLAALPAHKISAGYKSKFLDDAEKIKFVMDQTSPSLCLAKWKQVSLHLTTGLNNSCYHPPLHKINIEDIGRNPSALHNTAHKKEQRRLMLNGQRPSECEYCWNMEDLGKLSDRHYRSGEPWAQKDFGRIVSSDYTDDIDPSYVEVNFNSACNLKCSYCSPQFSSSWADEVQRHGAYPTAKPHNDPAHFTGNRRVIPVREHNPYVDAFWAWWPTLYPELEHFRMTGGEPLMDKNTYRVFDHVLANPSPKLHLNVTSNFSVEPVLFEKYMGYVKQLCTGKIEHFMQYVSLDTWGPQAEYIRDGMDFDLVWARADRYLTEVPSYNSLTFIVTMNNLSVTGLQRLFEGILELRRRHSTTYQRVWFDTPVLRDPAWQSLQILPPAYASMMEQTKDWMIQHQETAAAPFNGFKDYEIARLDRDIAWMRSAQDQDHSAAQADFYHFFSEHDRRRGTDFLKTFPEMSEWWARCAYHARTV